jgi:taurine--2-oxoglutarate transaminase
MSDPSTAAADGRQVLADDEAHVFHSWSAQGHINRFAVAGAAGCHFWDYEGRRYLDFSSQLVNTNLGHQHPVVVEAIREQAARLCTIGPSFANDARGRLARRVSELAPGDLDMVFFTNAGAEANENAIRLARLFTGRPKILTTYRSYHGATAGAIAATGDPRRWANEPVMHGFVHFFGPHPYRSPWASATPEQETERALAHLRDVITFEGPGTVAAVMLETVVGTNGVIVPPPGYLEGVRRLCDEFGIVFIADEVMTGFGRIGEWFGVDHWGVTPDLITFAKGINSGYVPLGGVIISRRIAETFRDRVFPGGLTYSGHPLACASALATLQVLEQDDVIGRVRKVGSELVGPRLAEIAARHPSVGDVRGLGMMWAVELVRDRASREPLVPFAAAGAANEPMNRVAARCRELGLWPFTHHNRIHVVPPLVISDEELEQGLGILDRALEVADSYTGG